MSVYVLCTKIFNFKILKRLSLLIIFLFANVKLVVKIYYLHKQKIYSTYYIEIQDHIASENFSSTSWKKNYSRYKMFYWFIGVKQYLFIGPLKWTYSFKFFFIVTGIRSQVRLPIQQMYSSLSVTILVLLSHLVQLF